LNKSFFYCLILFKFCNANHQDAEPFSFKYNEYVFHSMKGVYYETYVFKNKIICNGTKIPFNNLNLIEKILIKLLKIGLLKLKVKKSVFYYKKSKNFEFFFKFIFWIIKYFEFKNLSVLWKNFNNFQDLFKTISIEKLTKILFLESELIRVQLKANSARQNIESEFFNLHILFENIMNKLRKKNSETLFLKDELILLENFARQNIESEFFNLQCILFENIMNKLRKKSSEKLFLKNELILLENAVREIKSEVLNLEMHNFNFIQPSSSLELLVIEETANKKETTFCNMVDFETLHLLSRPDFL